MQIELTYVLPATPDCLFGNINQCWAQSEDGRLIDTVNCLSCTPIIGVADHQDPLTTTLTRNMSSPWTLRERNYRPDQQLVSRGAPPPRGPWLRRCPSICARQGCESRQQAKSAVACYPNVPETFQCYMIPRTKRVGPHTNLN